MNEEIILESEELPVAYSTFQDLLQKSPNPEEKIKLSLSFMRKILSCFQPPRFKDFWESKKICLPLFKELKNSKERSSLWSQYIEISSEARHLKEILDEQSLFAVEQIELALKSIEKDVSSLESLVAHSSSQVGPCFSSFLKAKESHYDALQKELYLLNILASKVQTFRKEILATEMRIRFKNQFFERLSKVGDLIFPRRKELIQTISLEFVEDVKKFVSQKESKKEYTRTLLLDTKDEIREFQQIAKQISLDSKSFNQTRELLSQCWDSLKKHEETLREEAKKKAEIYQKNMEMIEKNNQMQQERDKKLEEERRQKKEKFEALKQEIERVVKDMTQISIEELVQAKDNFTTQVANSMFSLAEKELLNDSLKQLRDKILDAKEKAILNLSKEELKSLAHLEHILQERKNQKAEIKAQLENYRKELSGSGFDFNKAIQIREIMEKEKERFSQVSSALEEIEDQIAELKEIL